MEISAGKGEEQFTSSTKTIQLPNDCTLCATLLSTHILIELFPKFQKNFTCQVPSL